ncbi:MAG: hypothetical protein B6242_05355 [Anaerolineaceae bacterium 4572_78]|nr:MAG: hypothetical protein B6242_05355 [Anaerolineaceae bacterium 4572_78]
MPVIPVIVYWIVGGIITAAGGYGIYSKWEDLVHWWKGKRIAVIGARETGKTHLIKFLLIGSIPVEYEQDVLHKTLVVLNRE